MRKRGLFHSLSKSTGRAPAVPQHGTRGETASCSITKPPPDHPWTPEWNSPLMRAERPQDHLPTPPTTATWQREFQRGPTHSHHSRCNERGTARLILWPPFTCEQRLTHLRESPSLGGQVVTGEAGLWLGKGECFWEHHSTTLVWCGHQ